MAAGRREGPPVQVGRERRVRGRVSGGSGRGRLAGAGSARGAAAFASVEDPGGRVQPEGVDALPRRVWSLPPALLRVAQLFSTGFSGSSFLRPFRPHLPGVLAGPVGQSRSTLFCCRVVEGRVSASRVSGNLATLRRVTSAVSHWVPQVLHHLAPHHLISAKSGRPCRSSQWGPRFFTCLVAISLSSSLV